MPTTIHDRITILVDIFAKRNNSAFARLIDSKESAIRANRHSTVPSYVCLQKIVKRLNVSGDWLLTGEGEMLKSKNSIDPKDSEIIALLQKAIESIQRKK